MPFYHLLVPKSHLGLPTTRSFSIFREFGQQLMGERPWEALQKILTTPQPHFLPQALLAPRKMEPWGFR